MRSGEETWSVPDEVERFLEQVKTPEYFISLHYAQMNLFLSKESSSHASGSLFCYLPDNAIYVPLSGYIPFKDLAAQIDRIERDQTRIIQVEPAELSPPCYDYVITCDQRLDAQELQMLRMSQDQKLYQYCTQRYEEQQDLLVALADKNTQQDFFDQLDLACAHLSRELEDLLAPCDDDVLFEGTFLLDGERTLFYPAQLRVDPELYLHVSPAQILARDAKAREISSCTNQLSLEMNDLSAHVLSLHIIDEQLSRIIPALEEDGEWLGASTFAQTLERATNLYMELYIHTHSLTRKADRVKRGTVDLFDYFGITTHWIDFSKAAKEIITSMQSNEIPRRFSITRI